MLNIYSQKNRICTRSILLAAIVFVNLLLFSLASCTNKQQKDEVVAVEKTNETIMSTQEAKKNKTIIFFGNSLTAGYGLEDERQSYPSLIQMRLDSLGMNYTVVNAGLSGETSSGGNSRIDWVLRQKIDVFVLELGANDVLRGIDSKSTEENLRSILKKVKEKYPDAAIILAGMLTPPNMGLEYAESFNSIYPSLAEEFNAGLIPFLLEDVATKKELNLADGIHPNAEGYKIVYENVWKVLKTYL
jgi:acyl-CoA thioesterase-1